MSVMYEGWMRTRWEFPVHNALMWIGESHLFALVNSVGGPAADLRRALQQDNPQIVAEAAKALVEKYNPHLSGCQIIGIQPSMRDCYRICIWVVHPSLPESHPGQEPETVPLIPEEAEVDTPVVT